MAYWLFKTEPDTFSIDDLARANTLWEGVRNYQARNFLRDQVQVGDEVFIYHSSCKQVGIAGIGKVERAGFPDPFAFDPDSPYFDPKSDPQAPRWYAVELSYSRHLPLLPLAALKANPALSGLPLVQKGSRLSVMPVSEAEWQAVLSMV
ncbi:EVE domain-containing protein [Oceanisphaera psychrotolerans]|uniref:EVE domain-containing protein n=1 Tax=Oceanisphaera psychrotolerans TaxID=1414654 RepID=A0A1J4QGR9_9GAMM|nr:EVE domain-containing protein [Oceanisphaera psychrotolerans]OIN11127.1 EVE domain-containing protein [Oceanisphaera psychrotolerans]